MEYESGLAEHERLKLFSRKMCITGIINGLYKQFKYAVFYDLEVKVLRA